MKQKSILPILFFILSLMVISVVPKEGAVLLLRFIQKHGIGTRQLDFIFRAMSYEAATSLILVAAYLVLIISLLKILRNALRPRTPGLNQPREKKTEAADSTISYMKMDEKAKYIAQLDSYLQNGLVTKEEYQVLKERYNKRRQ